MNNERIKEIKDYLKSRNRDKKSWLLVDEANDILLDMNNEIDIPLYISENNNYDIVLLWLVNVLGDQNYLELEDQFCIDWDSQEIAERLDYFCCDYEVKKKAIESLKI